MIEQQIDEGTPPVGSGLMRRAPSAVIHIMYNLLYAFYGDQLSPNNTVIALN